MSRRQALGWLGVLAGGAAVGFCGMEVLFGEMSTFTGPGVASAAWWAWSGGLWGGMGALALGVIALQGRVD